MSNQQVLLNNIFPAGICDEICQYNIHCEKCKDLQEKERRYMEYNDIKLTIPQKQIHFFKTRMEGFEGFEAFEGGQTAGLNALKNRWLGRVAARVALERPAEGFEGFEAFEGAQTAGLNALKNRWLGRVAARVALERPAGGFEGFEGFEAFGLKAGKRQAWTP